MEQFCIPDYWKCTDLKDAFGEEWKQVELYDGFFKEGYSVSNYGRVKSLGRKVNHVYYPTKILKQTFLKKKKKYLRVSFSFFGKKINTVLVHKLVAQHFVPNCLNKETINHNDGNKQNNFFWNLSWNTYDENNKHAKLTGLNKVIGETHHWARLSKEQVLDIFDNNSDDNCSIATKYNCTPECISMIKTGKNWSSVTGKEYTRKKRM
jgi:hypothetical protein